MPRIVALGTVSVAISGEARPQQSTHCSCRRPWRTSSGGPAHAPTPLLSSAPTTVYSRGHCRPKLRQLAYTTGLRVTEAPGATPPPRRTRGPQIRLYRGHSSKPEVIRGRRIPGKRRRTLPQRRRTRQRARTDALRKPMAFQATKQA
ncbi:hypothetical protein MTO96_040746 [Rhipicephalus appendiculatus]